MIRKKKFWRYLIEGRYPIAIDGTQKLARSERLSEHWLERNVGKADQKRTQYYVSVLEASFVFSNGMVIPLMSEFLDYEKGDTSKHKQGCEQRAFVASHALRGSHLTFSETDISRPHAAHLAKIYNIIPQRHLTEITGDYLHVDKGKDEDTSKGGDRWVGNRL